MHPVVFDRYGEPPDKELRSRFFGIEPLSPRAGETRLGRPRGGTALA